MKFAQYLGKTFLVFAASGLGTSVGVGIGMTGLLYGTKKLTGKIANDIEKVTKSKAEEKDEATA
ncbi:hypothetical protein SEA_SHERA_32 [Streptomyces phage SheRa]|nr:hypothetical protein SEA_SHERA_32 [Streptomyces phage SheRa]